MWMLMWWMASGTSGLAGAVHAPTTVAPLPVRVHRLHTERQYLLRQSALGTQLRQGELRDWTVRYDERTGQPWKLSGPGIALGPLPDAATVDRRLRAFLADHPALTGLSSDALALAWSHHDSERNIWSVRYDQVLPGTPHPTEAVLRGDAKHFDRLAVHAGTAVWGGTVAFSIQGERLVGVTAQTYPDAARAPVRVPATAAVTAARQALSAQTGRPAAATGGERAMLVVLPEEVPGGLRYRTIWLVHTPPQSARDGRSLHAIDAQSGEVVAAEDATERLTGTLHLEYDERNPAGGLTVGPVEGVFVQGSDGDWDRTDSDGRYSVSGETATALLLRDFVGVENLANRGASSTLALTESLQVWTADGEATQSELSAARYAAEARSWMHTYSPDHVILSRGVGVVVDHTPDCRSSSSFDYGAGPFSIHLAGPYGDCDNHGRIRDVLMHEWGHGVLRARNQERLIDQAYREAFADTFTFLQTKDANIAPGYYLDGSPVREVASNLRYPEGYWASYPASASLILSGALWDWWTLLGERDGTDAATAHLSRLLDALSREPYLLLPDVYDAILLFDDDDGDLSNGTPNECELARAFGAHGLGPLGWGAPFMVGFEAIPNQPSSASDYAVTAELDHALPRCTGAEGPVSASVFWRTDPRTPFQETPLAVDGSRLTGAIPRVPSGSIVEYYLDVRVDSMVVTAPHNAALSPASFAVGALETVYCTDFEDPSDDWEILQFEDDGGAFDWECGSPLGNGGDPGFAFSGTRICGNRLVSDGTYRFRDHGMLRSPAIAVDGRSRLMLQYRRWLSVDDRAGAQATIRVNDRPVWTNATAYDMEPREPLERVTTTDRAWVLHTVPFASSTDDIEVGFELEVNRSGAYGGWNIDDVCIVAFAEEPVEDDTAADVDSGSEREQDSAAVPSGVDRPESDGGEKAGGCATVSASAPGGFLVLVAGIWAALWGRGRSRDTPGPVA